jgi:ferredoxin--NADP+ reductase
VDIVVDGELPTPTEGLSYQVERKLDLLRRAAERPSGGRRRIVFRYQSAPSRILGPDAVTGIEVERTDRVIGDDGRVRAVPTGDLDLLETGLVLTSVGYRGVATPGLPFDEQRGIIPNQAGRVLEAPDGAVFPGTYVTGWIKRGPTGFIGTNKSCAQETVQQLADDFNAGRLPEPAGSAEAFDGLLRSRRPQARPGGAVLRAGQSARRRLFGRR